MGTFTPAFNFSVVIGNTMPILLRYAPGGTLMDWTDCSVDIVVRLKDGSALTIPSGRISLVAPGSVPDATSPNLISSLLPAETAAFSEDFPNPYEIRVTDASGAKTTMLFGEIVPLFSAVEGE